MRDGILIFRGIHRVMRAEKALKAAGLDVRLLPVPRQLSSDCGLALAFRVTERERVNEELEAAGCPAAGVYAREGQGYRRLA